MPSFCNMGTTTASTTLPAVPPDLAVHPQAIATTRIRLARVRMSRGTRSRAPRFPLVDENKAELDHVLDVALVVVVERRRGARVVDGRAVDDEGVGHLDVEAGADGVAHGDV